MVRDVSPGPSVAPRPCSGIPDAPASNGPPSRWAPLARSHSFAVPSLETVTKPGDGGAGGTPAGDGGAGGTPAGDGGAGGTPAGGGSGGAAGPERTVAAERGAGAAEDGAHVHEGEEAVTAGQGATCLPARGAGVA